MAAVIRLFNHLFQYRCSVFIIQPKLPWVLKSPKALRNRCSATAGNMACTSSGIKQSLLLIRAHALAELNNALVARGDNGLTNWLLFG
jgi:hypothetical protein